MATKRDIEEARRDLIVYQNELSGYENYSKTLDWSKKHLSFSLIAVGFFALPFGLSKLLYGSESTLFWLFYMAVFGYVFFALTQIGQAIKDYSEQLNDNIVNKRRTVKHFKELSESDKE